VEYGVGIIGFFKVSHFVQCDLSQKIVSLMDVNAILNSSGSITLHLTTS